jgi:hypothetical protein
MRMTFGSILIVAALWPAGYPAAAFAQPRPGFRIAGGIDLAARLPITYARHRLRREGGAGPRVLDLALR